MNQLQDITSTIKTLRDGIAKGYWTLEDLDKPPPGSISKTHRNLLRDEPKSEHVEAGPSPRDFTPAATPEPDPFDF
ncbi:hypothetical protein [uncultured Mediterranean phage uvMED]|nr:hypothetical protein [uncultured Mediterranean phage uvMED]